MKLLELTFFLGCASLAVAVEEGTVCSLDKQMLF